VVSTTSAGWASITCTSSPATTTEPCGPRVSAAISQCPRTAVALSDLARPLLGG
jgi:hypothetical protein